MSEEKVPFSQTGCWLALVTGTTLVCLVLLARFGAQGSVLTGIPMLLLSLVFVWMSDKRHAYLKRVLGRYAEQMLQLWYNYQEALEVDTQPEVLQAMFEQINTQRRSILLAHHLAEVEVPTAQDWQQYLPTDAEDRWISPVRGRHTGNEAEHGISTLEGSA